MSDSSCIDSPCKEGAMPKSYSSDLRKRVIGAVEAGASRHEAAEHFEIVPSTAVRWLQCWNETGSCAPKPRGGSVSHLEAPIKSTRRKLWRSPKIPASGHHIQAHASTVDVEQAIEPSG